MNAYQLPASSPEAQGVDPRAIRALVEAWEGNGVRPFALTIIRHGHVIASATWAPYVAGDNVMKYSLSKTFTASAVGLAVADGLVDLDATAASYFPEITGLGPRAKAITVRNLLSMASGHTTDTAPAIEIGDPVGSFLRIEPDEEPGSVFCYNQGCTLTLSAIVQTVTGQPLHEYLRPRLFDPLGIGEVFWLPLGPYDMGFSGLHVPVDAVARLGLMLLQGGEFGGRRILPEAWTEEAMTVHVPNGPGNPDWSQGYGFQMWRSRHGWRGDGAFGQLCLVLREYDLVLAACAQVEDMQLEVDLVWEHLLPGLSDEPLPGPSDDASPEGEGGGLATFLAERALPALRSSVPPTPGRHDLVATGDAAPMVAATGRVVLDEDGLTLDDGSGPVTVPLGDGTWERARTSGRLEAAGTGGWTSPDVLHAKVVPLFSPHVLEVVADVAAGTASLAWQVPPLGNVSPARPGF
ncbi:MAG TPA: serine hydrolase [Propionibacteriaceae bacterium]|nr:serine hydrolase [Propionibacteriaceae bacterium]